MVFVLFYSIATFNFFFLHKWIENVKKKCRNLKKYRKCKNNGGRS